MDTVFCTCRFAAYVLSQIVFAASLTDGKSIPLSDETSTQQISVLSLASQLMESLEVVLPKLLIVDLVLRYPFSRRTLSI
jgi:hypothetical protein